VIRADLRPDREVGRTVTSDTADGVVEDLPCVLSPSLFSCTRRLRLVTARAPLVFAAPILGPTKRPPLLNPRRLDMQRTV
jgi:hypothetical protein